ncbi:MAG: hypothetical protein IJY11_02335 [Clostridia bacterium]|nr:hypothetical protein [Clostridia bacterium]
MKDLFAVVRKYGINVLILGLIARLLNGLSKKLAAASAALSSLVARKKESCDLKEKGRDEEKRAA